MKKTIVIFALSAFILVAHSSMAQEGKNDPTYSANNYKHANKAAYAKKINKDKSATLDVSEIRANENYKQPATKVRSNHAGLAARKMDKSTKSYKHPNGL